MSSQDVELDSKPAGQNNNNNNNNASSSDSNKTKMIIIAAAAVCCTVVIIAIIVGVVVGTKKDDDSGSGTPVLVAGTGAGVAAAPNKASVVQSSSSGARRRQAKVDPAQIEHARKLIAQDKLGAAFLDLAFDDAGTDYSNTQQHFSVYHPATTPMDSINTVLCIIDQMRVASFVNTGKYVALVDESRCSGDSGSGGGGGGGGGGGSGGGGGGNAGQLNLQRTVNEATRLDDNSPQLMISWYGNSTELVRIFLETKSAPTAANPFGSFKLSYKMKAEGGFFGSDIQASASIRTIPVASGSAYDFFLSVSIVAPGVGVFPLIQASAVVTFNDADGTGTAFVRDANAFSFGGSSSGASSGASSTGFSSSTTTTTGSVSVTSTGGSAGGSTPSFGPPTLSETWYALSYNPTHALVAEASSLATIPTDPLSGVCLDLVNEKEFPWQYSLFNLDGSKVAFNGGFSFTFDAPAGAETAAAAAGADGRRLFGYVGYWGIWTELGYDVSLPDGTVVSRDDFGSTTGPIQYTISTIDGKLVRHSVVLKQLTEITSVKFSYYDYSGGRGSTIVQYRTAPSPGFYIVATTSFDSNTFRNVETPISPIVDITPTGSNSLYLYSNELGGSIVFTAGQTTISYTTSADVNPDDSVLYGDASVKTLYCFNDCPKTELTSSDLSVYNGVYMTDPADVASAIQYTLDPAVKQLQRGGSTVRIGAGVTPSSTSFYSYGISSGIMVTDVAGLTTIAEASDGAGDVYYTYDFGSSWSSTVVVTRVSDSTIITFDQPLQLEYTHSTANDRNGDATNDGTPVLFSYGGEGDLWGIPWDFVDTNNDGVPDHGAPAFALKDGTAIGASGDYVVKATYGDIILGDATPADCQASGLSIGAPLSAVPLVYTGLAVFPHENQPIPDITDEPKVIAGVIQ